MSTVVTKVCSSHKSSYRRYHHHEQTLCKEQHKTNSNWMAAKQK